MLNIISLFWNRFHKCSICAPPVTRTHLGAQQEFFTNCPPDPLALHKQLSSLNFWYHVQICLSVGEVFPNLALKARCTVLGDCVRAYSKTQKDFSLEANSIPRPGNNKNKILTYFFTFSENLRLFQQELPELLAPETMSKFLGHSVWTKVKMEKNISCRYLIFDYYQWCSGGWGWNSNSRNNWS